MTKEERYSTEPPGVGWTYEGDGRWSRPDEDDGVKDGARVAIVGGGASGLFTAYLINQHMPDVAVTVLEATERVGGKILTDEFDDGTPFEAGIPELYEYPDTEDLLRTLIEDDLGLATADMTGGAILFKDEVFVNLNELENEHGYDVRKRVESFYRKAASTGKSQYWIPEGDDFVQPYHVVGGLGCIPAGLLEKVDADVKTSTRVIRILKEGKGYDISTIKTKGSDIIGDVEYFDAVVVALPCPWLRTVEWGEELTDMIRDMPEGQYDLSAHRLRVTILFDEKWWKSLKIPGDFWLMDMFNGCLCYDESSRWELSSKEDEDDGVPIGEHGHVLSFLLTGTDALLLCSANQDDGDIIELLLESLPMSMREDAQEHYVDAKVHRYLGGIAGGDNLFTEGVKKHVPDPSGHPGVFLTNTHLYGLTLNAALTAADAVVEMLGDYLGGKGVV